MNSHRFEGWWENTVLDKLPDQSVVVIDNAKYHPRQTEDSKTRQMVGERQKFRNGWRREESVLTQRTKFISTRKDIQILRLLVGHSELNPIELIWVQVKSEVARKNTTFKIKDVQTLVCETLRNVTKEDWGKAIKHVIKVDDAFWEVDFGEHAPDVAKMIIDIHPDEDDSHADVEILDNKSVE